MESKRGVWHRIVKKRHRERKIGCMDEEKKRVI
jgi:hypothetical protein